MSQPSSPPERDHWTLLITTDNLDEAQVIIGTLRKVEVHAIAIDRAEQDDNPMLHHVDIFVLASDKAKAETLLDARIK